MKHIKCQIISNQEIAKGIFEMVLDSRGLPDSLPGQFVMLYLDKGDTLLPRPISICKQGKNVMMLVYKVVGTGTKYLSNYNPGDNIRLMGPLGNGFTIDPAAKGQKGVALVGGGIGIPPLVSLFSKLKDMAPDTPAPDVFLGFRDDSFLTNFFGENVHTTNGNIIELLERHAQEYDEMYACGPKPMLAALSSYATKKNIRLQVSLEERMACGVGTCMGCVTSVVDDSASGYMKICCEGPVFYSDKVVLN